MHIRSNIVLSHGHASYTSCHHFILYLVISDNISSPYHIRIGTMSTLPTCSTTRCPYQILCIYIYHKDLLDDWQLLTSEPLLINNLILLELLCNWMNRCRLIVWHHHHQAAIRNVETSLHQPFSPPSKMSV